MPKTIKVLIKGPNKDPYVKEIENTLDNLQDIVDGYIECVGMPGIKNVDLYVNEEGKLDKLPGNFWLPEYEDCVVGTCFMVAIDTKTGDLTSLNDKQLKKCMKYISYYQLPEGTDLYKDYHILKSLMDKKYQKISNSEDVM